MLSDVLIGVDEAAARHGIALDFQDTVILAIAYVAVWQAFADVVNQQLDMLFRVAGTVFAVMCVITKNLVDGCPDPDQAIRKMEQFQVTLVPHHQAHILINDTNALIDILDGGLQQGTVELQDLRRLVDDRDDVGDADTTPLKCRIDYDACRRSTQHRGQKALGKLDDIDRGAVTIFEWLAGAQSIIIESTHHLAGGEKAFAEHLEITHRGGAGPQAVDRSLACFDAVDEQGGLNTLDYPLRGDLGDEDIAEQVDTEREHDPMGEGVTKAEAE